MFKIDGKQNVYITRGDSAICEVGITDPNFPYEEYELQDGDYLVFTVRAQPKQIDETNEPLIQKTLAGNQINIAPEDTENLEYGQYYYDVKLFFANGEVNTIIPSTTGKYFNPVADLPSFYVCEVTN